MGKGITKTITGFLILGLLILLLFTVVGFAVSYAWNITFSQIFGIPEIDERQGIALFVLTRFLFGRGFDVVKEK